MEVLTKAVDAASMFWQSLEQRERAMLGYAAVWLVVALVAGARRRDRDQLKREIFEELAGAGGSRI